MGCSRAGGVGDRLGVVLGCGMIIGNAFVDYVRELLSVPDSYERSPTARVGMPLGRGALTPEVVHVWSVLSCSDLWLRLSGECGRARALLLVRDWLRDRFPLDGCMSGWFSATAAAGHGYSVYRLVGGEGEVACSVVVDRPVEYNFSDAVFVGVVSRDGWVRSVGGESGRDLAVESGESGSTLNEYLPYFAPGDGGERLSPILTRMRMDLGEIAPIPRFAMIEKSGSGVRGSGFLAAAADEVVPTHVVSGVESPLGIESSPGGGG